MTQKSFKQFITEKVKSIVFEKVNNNSNTIFVFLGISNLVNIDKEIKLYIADFDTFLIDADESIFNRKWFTKTFTELNKEKGNHILSYAQYCYLIHYIDVDFF